MIYIFFGHATRGGSGTGLSVTSHAMLLKLSDVGFSLLSLARLRQRSCHVQSVYNKLYKPQQGGILVELVLIKRKSATEKSIR
jgi:hypothetical protein